MSEDDSDSEIETHVSGREHASHAADHIEQALDHVDKMDGSGVWGLWCLVIGLIMKGVLWQAKRKMPKEDADG